ncbi:MAG: hypothetical protein COA43_04150 [Robiginitomaculum sp.]|nr:MAG: hypothetical protein COA43_04150 [Robiginitomaculum sp.]
MPPETLLTFLASNLIWQTTLISVCVFLALKFLPRTHVHLRYRIALGGLFGCLILCAAPFAPSLAQNISVGIRSETVNTSMQVNLVEGSVHYTNHEGEILAQPPVAQSKNTLLYLRNTAPTVLAIIWMLGTLFMLVRIFLAALRANALAKSARIITIPSQHSLSRRVTIAQSSPIMSPLVLGFLRPVILVPQNFDLDLNKAETRTVLEHEIAHIHRNDIWTNLAQRIVLALLWWCAPLYWINTQIGIEREKLCDDIAAQKTGKGKALARALVDLAENHINASLSPSARIAPIAPIVMCFHPHASQLAERVQRLYKGSPMTKISLRLLVTTSLIVPLAFASLVIVTPRAFAHNPQTHSMTQARLLYRAASSGDIASVKQLIAQGVDVNIVQIRDGSPLIAAVRNDDYDMTQFLLSSGANVNLPSRGDGNPLIMAAKHGNMKIAKLLIAHDADVNAIVKRDETPLINAARNGHLDMVKYLVAQGADVSLGAWEDHHNGAREWRTPFGEATKHGKTKVAEYLKSKGASEADGTPKLITYHPAPSHNIVKGRTSSRFGYVRKLDNKVHQGIDIANSRGTPIYAPANGRIIIATDTYPKRSKLGKTLVLETEDGVQTLFAHLDDYTVQTHAIVKAGDLIAHMGNTGVTTGPHVHIETRIEGKLFDPTTVWAVLK